MFCTKCAAQILDGDRFCPYCGAPQKIRNGQDLNDELAKKTAATVDVTPEDNLPPEQREYIGQHKKYGDELQETYSGYYGSMEENKRKKASGCFVRGLLIALITVLLVIILLSGILLIRGKNPIEYTAELFRSITSSQDIPDQNDDSQILITSASDTVSATDAPTTTTTTSATTTTTTTVKTTRSTTTTTKRTTTTTKPTTTAAPVGQLIRDTSVGKWTADISALNITVIGSKIKTINITIDKNGNANVSFKVGFVTVKTTGSFTVQDDGRTDLIIKVPYTDDIINVVGYSKVVNNNQIVFRCSQGDITLNRK